MASVCLERVSELAEVHWLPYIHHIPSDHEGPTCMRLSHWFWGGINFDLFHSVAETDGSDPATADWAILLSLYSFISTLTHLWMHFIQNRWGQSIEALAAVSIQTGHLGH